MWLSGLTGIICKNYLNKEEYLGYSGYRFGAVQSRAQKPHPYRFFNLITVSHSSAYRYINHPNQINQTNHSSDFVIF